MKTINVETTPVYAYTPATAEELAEFDAGMPPFDEMSAHERSMNERLRAFHAERGFLDAGNPNMEWLDANGFNDGGVHWETGELRQPVDEVRTYSATSEPVSAEPVAQQVFKRLKYPAEWRQLSYWDIQERIWTEEDFSGQPEFMYFLAVHPRTKVLECAWDGGVVEQMPLSILHFFWNNKKVHEAMYREDAYKAVADNPEATVEMLVYILNRAHFERTLEHARKAVIDRDLYVDPELLNRKGR